jgi:ABC-type multidrug transport system fused ATPase/permease subunit
MHQRVNIFEYNVKIFNICGVIPSDNINSSLWKSILFRMFLIFSFVLSTLMVTLQILALYFYWGNIWLITDCLGLLTGFAASYTTTPYFIYYWEDVSKLMESLETKSIYSMELIRTNQRHMKIVNDSRNLAQLLSKSSFVLILLSGVMYILPTFVRHLSASDKEILQEAETVEGFTKYFVFVMWLPLVVKQPFVIRLTYVLQCICTFRAFMFAAAFVPIEIMLLIYTGTQFKLLSSILSEMDETIYRLENSDEIIDEVQHQKNDPEGEDLPKSTQSGMLSEVPKYEMDRRKGKETLAERQMTNQSRSEILQNLLQVYNFNRTSGKFIELSSEGLTPTKEEDFASLFFLEFIKLHQECIK